MNEDLAPQVAEFTNDLLDRGGFRLEASADEAGDGINVQVAGDDIPLLLAHNAELLDALEYICNRVFGRDAGPDARITFDSANYRAGREKELRLMAEKAAERVRRSRVPFSFDAMTPNERRIIHLALVDDRSVRTESQGGGPDRKVTIFPA